MTTAASITPYVGHQAAGNFFQPDDVRRHTLGTILSYANPFWGGGEAVYLSVPASTPLVVGTPVVWDVANSAIAVPNTANLGMPLAFVMNAFPSNPAVTYGWFVISGRYPVASNASVAAAAPIGIAAAGRLGANSAGKQVLNARVQAPATTTVIKANTSTQAGSTLLKVSNTDGWFVGVALSGTGIPALTVITAISEDDRTVTMSLAATATGSVSVTGTYNDGTIFWNVISADRPFAQGAIT